MFVVAIIKCESPLLILTIYSKRRCVFSPCTPPLSMTPFVDGSVNSIVCLLPRKTWFSYHSRHRFISPGHELSRFG